MTVKPDLLCFSRIGIIFFLAKFCFVLPRSGTFSTFYDSLQLTFNRYYYFNHALSIYLWCIDPTIRFTFHCLNKYIDINDYRRYSLTIIFILMQNELNTFYFSSCSSSVYNSTYVVANFIIALRRSCSAYTLQSYFYFY